LLTPDLQAYVRRCKGLPTPDPAEKWKKLEEDVKEFIIDDICYIDWDPADQSKFVTQYRDKELEEKYASSESDKRGEFAIFYKNVRKGRHLPKEEFSSLLAKLKVTSPTALLGLKLTEKL